MGNYLCFNLKKVFNNNAPPWIRSQITDDSLEISCDPFLFSWDYNNFLFYKSFFKKTANDDFDEITEPELEEFIASNPEFFFTYVKTGDYYYFHHDYQKSLGYYNFALQKEISSKLEQKSVEEKIKHLQNDTPD